MRATRRGLGAASLLAVLFALILTACKNAAPAATDPDSKFCVRKFSGEAIGTWWHVTALEAEPKALTGEKLEAAIVDAIAEVDRLMSTYREDSEVVAINRAPAGAWVNVSPSTSEVIALAIETASLTGGAFDPTVAPIVDALGFGPESKLTPEQVKTIPIGIAHLTLDAPNRRVKKDDGAVMIDLSAIAKGYAVDRVVDALAALGIENMMVEIGGEVRVAGRRADGGPWRIGIDAPVAGTIPGEKLASIVELTDIALATSGSYRQFRDVGGKRVTHIVDPRTRESVAHDLVSVSVLAPTCAQADALATGLFVLGKNEGTTLCAKLSGVDCFFITEDGTTAATPGFARRMKHD